MAKILETITIYQLKNWAGNIKLFLFILLLYCFASTKKKSIVSRLHTFHKIKSE